MSRKMFRSRQDSNLRRENPIGFRIQLLNHSDTTAFEDFAVDYYTMSIQQKIIHTRMEKLKSAVEEIWFRGSQSLLFCMPSLAIVVVVVIVVFGLVGHVRAGVSNNGFDNQVSTECRVVIQNECQTLQTTTCFGINLPYTETSSELVNSNFTQQQIYNDMSRWEGLQNLPRCWVVLQPLLCTFYMPRCHPSNGTNTNIMVDKPPQELCKRARTPCRVIEESLHKWPDFLDCDSGKFHSSNFNCKNNELRGNASTKCMAPMLWVESPFNHYDGFEGCALPCKDTLYSEEDDALVSTFIKWIGSITILATGAVVATFIIDWPTSDTHKVYPSIIVFYVNLCYFFATCGWMVQFLPNAKEDIVCRKDLTIRRQEPACKLNLTQVAECEMAEKPSLNFIIWSIAIYFFGGLLVSTWAWTSASVRTWKRFLYKMSRRFKSENSLDQLPNTVAKHKLIAQAFAKRHQFPVNGRLSLNLYSTHEDPIGFNRLLDPNHLCQDGDDTEMQTHNNTDGHEEISEWAAGLPHLVTRRGALIPPHSSNSVSCVSEDSRRPSCDSAISEIAVRNLQGSSHHDDRHHKKRSIRDKFRMGRRSRSGKIWNSPFRRGNGGSSSSLESNPGSQILPAITALIDKRIRNPNDEELAPLNNAPLTGPTPRKPIIMKELAVQTSLEKLSFPSQTKNSSRAYQPPSNNLTADKATQSSLLSLHEIGTQTKKSVVKKGDKDRQKRTKTDKNKKKNNDEVVPEPQEDPVLKLLTPN